MTIKGIISYRGEDLDVDKMEVEGLRHLIKIMMELMNHEHDRVTALQDKVFALEMQIK